MSGTVTADDPTDERLLEALNGTAAPSSAVAERTGTGRGRARARLQSLEDRGLVVRRGDRTSARWALTPAGRDRLRGLDRLVADGGDPGETDDDRFDPEVEEIPVEIGDEDGEWAGGGGFDLGKWKLIGGAVVAFLAVVLVVVLVRKLRG